MKISSLRLGLCFVATAFTAVFQGRGADTNEVSLPIVGQTFIHDPSTIVKDNGKYFVFGTGRGIITRYSTDLGSWRAGPAVFSRLPAWTLKVAPGFDGRFWAPDLIRLNEKFYLYYSVSAWGKQTSVIGLATNPTLDSTSTNYHWTDCGPVISSISGSDFNTIDPSVMRDDDGRLWLTFGSFWQGIYLTELNSQTGLRADTNSPPVRLAWNQSIEASCLTRHGKFYYLFVNWGQCCRGTNSTYEVHIGRAQKITGPYLDRDGVNLVDGGGTMFLESSGRFIGPGHIGILNDHGTNWFSYHFYDAEAFGRSRLALGKIIWSEDGWPRAAKTLSEK